jgi:hypothetical protein
MTKICCVFVALFTLGDDKLRHMPAKRGIALFRVSCRQLSLRLSRVRSKAYVAILPPLTLTEESSVYGKRIIAAFAVPLLGF